VASNQEKPHTVSLIHTLSPIHTKSANISSIKSITKGSVSKKIDNTDLLDLLLKLGELVVQLPLPELDVSHPQLQLHLHLINKGIPQLAASVGIVIV
jgi:hypothetical protein